MKKLIYFLTFTFSIIVFGQEEIKMPELDNTKKVYTLKFSPDPNNEQVISAYMKGTTEKDSLRFWAEGTIFTQKIMVTVFTENKNDVVKVSIVKNHWEDNKITGETKNGSFQESFDTAGKFGIVIASKTPDISFYLAVWTGGEQLAGINNIYRSVSNQNTTINTTNTNGAIEKTNQNDNSGALLMYLLIGALIIIILLLAIMVFRKKKNHGLMLFLLLFIIQQSSFAGAQEFSAPGFGGVGIKYPGVMDIINFANKLPDMVRNGRRYLDDEYDLEGEANLGNQGGPGIPSSCIPDNNQDEDNIQNGQNGRDGRDGVDGRNGIDGINGADGQDANDPNNGMDGNDGFDGNNGTNGNNGDNNDDKYKPRLDDSGKPKYDKDGIPINYDNSKYPKYDKNGNPINYAEHDPNGNFDSKGRPRFDKNKKPIEYDDQDYPKYDSKGNPINYNPDDFVNPPKRNKVGGTHQNNKENPEKGKKSSYISSKSVFNYKIYRAYKLDINALKVLNNRENLKPVKYSEANMFPFISLSSFNTSNNREEGCDCLKSEYEKMNTRRLNLERLRIIYAHAMKKINAGIAFGDGVSAVHGVSALVWQNQKMIILKKSIPTLNKAYDDKYREMIEALEENLKRIGECEALLGYENWYNHAGFIYYQFMADKYKRN